MDEIKEFALSFSLMLLLAAVSYEIVLFIDEDALSDYDIYYTAELKANGLLYENYTYNIRSNMRYHMLYRIWDSNLWFTTQSNEGIQCVNISIHGGHFLAVPYVKDVYGSVWFFNNNTENDNYISYISSKAKRNEAGVYVPRGIPSGRYVVSYVFRLNPDVLYDGHNYFIPLVLATEHHAYKKVELIFPSKFTVYSFPPTLHRTSQSSKTVLSGFLEDDFPLKTHLLFSNIGNFSHHMIERVNYDLKGSESQAALLENIRFWCAWFIAYGLLYAIIILPFVYLIAYLLWGRERKRYAIPEEVMEPPAHRAPWLVNFIFKNEGDKISYHSAFIATLLDLHRRGKIKISDDGERIEILDYENDLDVFETNVMDYLYNLGENGVVNLKRIKEEIKHARKTGDYRTLLRYQGLENQVYLSSVDLEKARKEFIITPERKIEILFIVGIFWALFGFFYILILAFDLALFMVYLLFIPLLYMLQVGLMWWHPDVLGRWKDDYYKEKLMWDRFREFLENKKKIREKYYIFSDFWDDWLIYGYALEVGNDVLDALNKGGIQFPLLTRANNAHSYIVYVSPGSTSTSVGGAGGGFGGGGAGAR